MGKDNDKSKRGFRKRISDLGKKAAEKVKVKIDINRLNACSVLLNFILGHNDRSIKRGLRGVQAVGVPNFSQIIALTKRDTPAGEDFMKLVGKSELESEMNNFLNAVNALYVSSPPYIIDSLEYVKTKFNTLYDKAKKRAKLGDPFSYGITDKNLWDKAKEHLNNYMISEANAEPAAIENHEPESTTSEVSTEPTANRPNAASEADTKPPAKPAAPGRIDPSRMNDLNAKMSGANASTGSGTPKSATPDPAPVTSPSNISAPPPPPPAPGAPSAPPPPPPPPAAVKNTAEGYKLKKGGSKSAAPTTQAPALSPQVPVVIKYFNSDDARFKRIQEIIEGGEGSNLTQEELNKVGSKLSKKDKVKEYVKILEREGVYDKLLRFKVDARKRYVDLRDGTIESLTTDENKKLEDDLAKRDPKPQVIKMLAKELAGEYFSASDKKLINQHYNDDKLEKSKSKTGQKVDFENLFKKSRGGQIKENYWPIFLNSAKNIDNLIDAYKEWSAIITNDEYFTLNVKSSKNFPMSEVEQKKYKDHKENANNKCFTFNNRVKNLVNDGNKTYYDILSGKKVATKTVKPKTPGATPVKDNDSWLDKYEWMKPFLNSKTFGPNLKDALSSEQLRRDGTESIQQIKMNIKEFNETYEGKKKDAEDELSKHKPGSKEAKEADVILSSLEDSKKKYDKKSSNIGEQEKKYALVFDKDINLVSVKMILNSESGTLKEALKKLVEEAEKAKRKFEKDNKDKPYQPKITLKESLENVSKGNFEKVTDNFDEQDLLK